MLLRPLAPPTSSVASEPTRRPAQVRIGDLQLSSFVDAQPIEGTIVVDLPNWQGDDRRGGVTGERIEVRWREDDGVVTAIGTTVPGPCWGRVTVLVDTISEPRDERLARRVPVKVEVRLMLLRDDGCLRIATRTRNVSIGGVALDPVDVLALAPGDRGVIALDPRGDGVLAGVEVVAIGGGDLPLRLRFDEMAGAQQDRLVGLINREELRCTLR